MLHRVTELSLLEAYYQSHHYVIIKQKQQQQQTFEYTQR